MIDFLLLNSADKMCHLYSVLLLFLLGGGGGDIIIVRRSSVKG